MFKKLLSNLSFNPSMLEGIPDYHSLLKNERIVRRYGLGILFAVLVLELFIIMSPAKASVTTSPNNLLANGFSSPANAGSDCSNNTAYTQVLAYFNLNCADLAQAPTVTIKANADNKQLVSLNRMAYGQNGETSIAIGGQIYYFRPLVSGNGIAALSLKALALNAPQYGKLYVLYNSGNLVLASTPNTASTLCSLTGANACPKQSIFVRDASIANNNINGGIVRPNNLIVYTLAATNLSAKPIENYAIQANFSDVLNYVNLVNTYGGIFKGSELTWQAQTINPGQTVVENVVFAVDNPIPNLVLSASDTNYNNLKLVVAYGNVATVNLPTTIVKYIELKVNNGLPYAGQLISLIILVLLILFATYFLLHNSLINKELKCLKHDYLKNYKR